MKTINSCSSSQNAWDRLAHMYQVNNEAHILALTNQLKEHKIQENQTIHENVAKFIDLWDQLASVDEIIGEEDGFYANSLAPSYRVLMTSLMLLFL